MGSSKKSEPKKSLLSRLGPGFITGASDDDPSGIATYAQTGAMFGFGQLWTALFTLPFMTAVQEMCGRIGMVTGKGLAAVIRTHYSRAILYGAVLLLFIANTINIGADLGAMASAMQLITGGSFEILLLSMTAFTLILEIFLSYKTYSAFLKIFAFSLIAYVLAALVTTQDWGTVLLHTLTPHMAWNADSLMNIVAVLGTTISPYLFFWQAGEEVEEEVAQHKLKAMGKGVPRIDAGDIKRMRQDTAFGMLCSNLVMFFIMVTAATTLGANGIHAIATAADAAAALKPLAGQWASLLFAAGIIGTGLLAVPVLAGSASYALAETFNWNEGLSLKFRQGHGFYGVITIATVGGLIVNFLNIPPFTMLYYTAMLNGLAAPPLILLILLIANNKKIMGTHVNGWLSNVLGTLIFLLMTAAGVAMLWMMFPGSASAHGTMQKITEGKYLLNLSSAPIAPMAGQEQQNILAISDIATNDLIAKNIVFDMEIRLAGTVIHTQKNLVATGGVLQFNYTYPQAGIYELAAHFRFPGSAHVFAPEDYWVQVNEPLVIPAPTPFPFVAISLTAAACLAGGWLLGRKTR